MDGNKTLLRIRGFSDITFHGKRPHPTIPPMQAYTCFPSSSQLGSNLFVTSDLSERFKFLSEIVFESDEFNNFRVDLERMQLQYSQNDYLTYRRAVSHRIGYYNTAYHHSTWFQTTTDAPSFRIRRQGRTPSYP